jgi:hypothetical protein
MRALLSYFSFIFDAQPGGCCAYADSARRGPAPPREDDLVTMSRNSPSLDLPDSVPYFLIGQVDPLEAGVEFYRALCEAVGAGAFGHADPKIHDIALAAFLRSMTEDDN